MRLSWEGAGVSETTTGTALLPARWPSFCGQARRRVLPAAICLTVVVVLSVVRWVLAATTGRDVLTGRSVDQPARSAWTDDIGPDDLAG